MISILKLIVLVSLIFQNVTSKLYEPCEFVEEIYNTHKVLREDIYKHLCIAEGLHSNANNFGMLGIYGVSEHYWCGEDEPSGGCNVLCADLMDDDIADDVACGSLVLQQQNLQAWGKSSRECRFGFEHVVEGCLAEIDAVNSFFSTNELTSTPTNTTEVSQPGSVGLGGVFYFFMVLGFLVVAGGLAFAAIRRHRSRNGNQNGSSEFSNALVV